MPVLWVVTECALVAAIRHPHLYAVHARVVARDRASVGASLLGAVRAGALMDRHTRTVDGARGHAARSGWTEAVRRGDPDGPEPRDYLEEPGWSIDLSIHNPENDEITMHTLGWFAYPEDAAEFVGQIRKAAELIATGELVVRDAHGDTPYG